MCKVHKETLNDCKKVWYHFEKMSGIIALTSEWDMSHYQNEEEILWLAYLFPTSIRFIPAV